MYQGVDGVTDLPAAFWYQKIFEAFPDAKVVLTVRDSEDVWLKSYVKQCDFDMNLEGCGFLQKLLIRSWSHRRYYALNDATNSAAFGSLQEESTLLAPVVQRLDNAIHRINHYPVDSVVCFVNTYPLDSGLSSG